MPVVAELLVFSGRGEAILVERRAKYLGGRPENGSWWSTAKTDWLPLGFLNQCDEPGCTAAVTLKCCKPHLPIKSCEESPMVGCH